MNNSKKLPPLLERSCIQPAVFFAGISMLDTFSHVCISIYLESRKKKLENRTCRHTLFNCRFFFFEASTTSCNKLSGAAKTAHAPGRVHAARVA